jgi:hypothetical protein
VIGSRTVKVIEGDVLVINGWRVDVTTLIQMLDPDKRVLWAFVRNGDRELRPVPYSEERVIWLAEEDIVRADNEV